MEIPGLIPEILSACRRLAGLRESSLQPAGLLPGRRERRPRFAFLGRSLLQQPLGLVALLAKPGVVLGVERQARSVVIELLDLDRTRRQLRRDPAEVVLGLREVLPLGAQLGQAPVDLRGTTRALLKEGEVGELLAERPGELLDPGTRLLELAVEARPRVGCRAGLLASSHRVAIPIVGRASCLLGGPKASRRVLRPALLLGNVVS